MKSLFDTILLFGMVMFYFCESLISEENDSHQSSITLTTAKVRANASPKPSSLYRRINVERVEEFKTTPLNLFRARDPERKNRLDAVWKWDYWCQLQPKTGNCSASSSGQQAARRESFYYDAQLDTCLSFTFSGCDGNKNNFISLSECERHCKGSTYLNLKDSTRTGNNCGLQPNAGLCMALVSRYYYDVNANGCKQFLYGGCGGNQNRFNTFEMCTERCQE